MTRPIINQIAAVLEKGVRSGAIRPGIDLNEPHMTLNALCFFSIANRHTFEAQSAGTCHRPRPRRNAAAKSPTCCGAMCGRTEPAQKKKPGNREGLPGAFIFGCGEAQPPIPTFGPSCDLIEGCPASRMQ
jgi:hypothetical protein